MSPFRYLGRFSQVQRPCRLPHPAQMRNVPHPASAGSRDAGQSAVRRRLISAAVDDMPGFAYRPETLVVASGTFGIPVITP
jgi:hypothetical protein